MPALEAEFKRVFGYDFTPSVLSDMIAECDKKEIKKLFKKIKTLLYKQILLKYCSYKCNKQS